MGIFKRFIRRDLAELHQNGVRVRMIGERAARDREVIALIEEAEALTKTNDALDLVVAFNYGSRNEIVRAARRIALDIAAGRIRPEDVTEERFEVALDTAGLPPPDLLIRTSGEQRLSNFLLWQSAYTELVFLDAYWPDFDKAMLEGAIRTFQQRDRRFGGVSARSHG
jgi:undecaprenyl diphosphate synthase